MSKPYLPTRPSKKRCLLLIGLMLGLYFFDNSPVVSFIGSQLYIHYVKPILWIGLAFIVLFLPRVRFKAKIKHGDFLNWWALNFAVIFIVVSVLAGIFIDGLGKSPYSHSLSGIFFNILLVGSILLGTELVRSYLVNSFTREENYVVFITITLFITIISFSLNKYIDFKNYEELVKFTAQYFVPEFSKNLLATYLAFLGGPVPAIIYMGILQAFKWLSPVLPDLQWITTGFVGVLCPVFALSIIQSMFAKESKDFKRNEQNDENPGSWIVISIFSIVIIWFVVGVFPIYPSAIATGSMKPGINPGDVILVKKAKTVEDIKALEKGDVIQFKKDNILISHRIINILEENNSLRYCTKGDNNSSPDGKLVKPEQIKGKVIQVIPKVGWPTILVKGKNNAPHDEFEF